MFSLIPWRQPAKSELQRRDSLLPFDLPAPLARMREELDELFGGFLTRWPTEMTRLEEAIEDKENELVVRVEAPGFEPEDFEVELQGQQLIVRAAHKTEKEEKEKKERAVSAQEMYRMFALPLAVVPEKVEAKYRQGILTITLPKTEEAKGHRIPVKE
jgi:HSP20 family protein